MKRKEETPKVRHGDASTDLIELNAESVADEIINAAEESHKEAELRIRVEHLLRQRIFDRLGIEWAKYEFTTGKGTLIEGSADALYGRAIIEYEPPRKFGHRPGVKTAGYNHAVDQVRGYITGLAQDPKQYHRYFGIVLDGFQVGFVKYRDKWIDQGPYPINKNTTMTMLEAIRGLKRKPLRADTLNTDLGPESSIAKSFVKLLYGKLLKSDNKRANMLFEDWKRVFKQVCGYTPKKIKGLEKTYQIPSKGIDYEALLFSIHTYFALIMKLIAAEVAALTGDSYLQSYIEKLKALHQQGLAGLKEEFDDLEKGGIFYKIGIRNFLEGDYFAWYLDIWDRDVANSIGEMITILGKYEPGTIELEPEQIKDMLKKLYQYLVPKDVRRKLGEYYTPDWLAEYLLDEVGYHGNLQKRLLDPSCGSGTFLVSAIKRAKEYGQEKLMGDTEILELILKNVVGFDLNPLAVIAARTNYLLALGTLRRYRKQEIEIPVYLADSILVESHADPYGKLVYLLRTSVQNFEMPAIVVDSGKLDVFLSLLDQYLANKADADEFGERASRLVELDERTLNACIMLFKDFQKLERQNKNRIWSKIIKNSFAPLFSGKYDFVIGNPPWIRWDNLPEIYRKVTEGVWERYGLLQQTAGRGLGKVKKDMAMLFVTVSVDKYLTSDGILAFLMPFTVFKNQAGAGFRAFLHNKCRVNRMHDMVELSPFPGVVNRTSMIILENGRNRFPIECLSWKKKESGSIGFDMSLQQVRKLTEVHDVIMEPIDGRNKPESSWLMAKEQALEAIRKGAGRSTYKASAGVFTGLNGAYFVDLLSQEGEMVTVKNIVPSSSDKDFPVEPRSIERERVYPLIRGRDLHRWSATPSCHIVLPINDDGNSISASEMRTEYPNCYSYFSQFYDYLIERKAEPFKTQLSPYRSVKSKKVKKKAPPPFYWLFNAKESLASYKVAWKEIAGKVSGKGQFIAAVIGPQKVNGKTVPVIPDHKLMFIPFTKETEAYYIAGILNSSLIRLIVGSYTIETAIDTHVVNHIRIPEFDTADQMHCDIATLSKHAHQTNDPEQIKDIEEHIDQKVAELYGLTNKELVNVKDSLRLISPADEEIEEASEDEEEEEE